VWLVAERLIAGGTLIFGTPRLARRLVRNVPNRGGGRIHGNMKTQRTIGSRLAAGITQGHHEAIVAGRQFRGGYLLAIDHRTTGVQLVQWYLVVKGFGVPSSQPPIYVLNVKFLSRASGRR